MNNDYDREGKIVIPQEGVIEIPVVEVGAVKLVVFLNGEQVLAEISESMDGKSITLTNPIGVLVSSVEDANADGDYKTTVSYGSWLPLAADRSIVVERSSIITICDPIQSLVESYLGEDHG